MTLRTNYVKQDWQKLAITFAIYLVAVLPVTWIATSYFLIPAIDMLNIMTKKANENDSALAKQFGDYIRTEMGKKYSEEHILYAILFIFFGVMFGAILFFVQLIQWSFIIAGWICKKLKVMPSMRLVIIRNNRMWLKF